MVDPGMAGIGIGVLGIAVASLGIWQQIKGKDGSGWGLFAFFLLITSCSKLEGI